MAKDIVIRDVEYDDVPYVRVPIQGSDEMAHFVDTSDATLESGSQMLDGFTAYADGTKVTGNIPNKSAGDLTVSGATVTVPAGNYASQATKSIPSGSATSPASISGTSASVDVGTNAITLTKSVNVTPDVEAGYIANGTSRSSTVSLTASITTSGAATITPGTTDQEIAAGTYLTGKQTIKGDPNLVGSRIVAPYSIFGIEGTAQLPVIVQDSTTHGLSIS